MPKEVGNHSSYKVNNWDIRYDYLQGSHLKGHLFKMIVHLKWFHDKSETLSHALSDNKFLDEGSSLGNKFYEAKQLFRGPIG